MSRAGIEQSVSLYGKEYRYLVRRSRRSRRITIRVRVWEGIEITIPWRMSLGQAQRFVIQSADWWLQKMVECNQQRDGVKRYLFVTGEKLRLLEREYELVVNLEPKRKRILCREEGNVLVIHAPSRASARKAVEGWYKQKAQEFFAEASRYYAEKLSCSVAKVSIGSPRAQWGSCSGKGVLRFNWKLLLGPKDIALYVVAHEVAHLRERNHGTRFWKTVALLDSNYKEKRRWLRKNAHRLVL